MTVPQDDVAWLRLVRSGQRPTWKLLAEGSGGDVLESNGFLASIVPRTPDRSVFNSVFYEDGERLLASLDELSAAYDEAGVRAWTVWVPEEDRETAAALAEAGHLDDAQPRDMGMELSALREPDSDPELEITEREDYGAMARLNEIAYGYPAGDFAVVAEAPMPDLRIYFGALGGEDVAALAIWKHGTDAVVIWVAAVPEARGRGISGRLLARALLDAGEQGMETTTLQATRLGYPVYEKLGYRDYGTQHMWERRKPS
jgi:GNAT superfamily N-acetyltransferase